MKLAHEIGSRQNASEAFWCLADAHADLGDDDLARAYRRDSLAILDELGLIDPDEARELLAAPRPERPRPFR